MALVKQFLLPTREILLGMRSIHTTKKLQSDDDGSSFAKFYFKLSGFYKYGLLEDDLLNAYDKDVIEAVRRLPEEMQLQRSYRAIRAFQAEINHSILPKEQWTKFEDDNHYLQPYLKEVMAEKREREEWEANY